MSVPIIDVAPLTEAHDLAAVEAVAARLREACTSLGFFYVVGHGVPRALRDDLERHARRFFALPEAAKAELAMSRGGRAWRGWFPVGGELTSGQPDLKEGLYLGNELPLDDPRVVAGRPLHGPNLWPAEVPELRGAALAYIDALTALGHTLMRGLARALDLDPRWFEARATTDPLILFRLFHYPAVHGAEDRARWGVGEHTDYGLLTILAQDDAGGLEVKTPRGWIDAPPVEDSFVCNLGDMLERMTGGRFRSTPHRVRNTSGRSRLSMPLFFDPSWDSDLRPVPGAVVSAAPDERWDGASVHDFEGTYGDYVTRKVARVFPALAQALER